MARILGRFLLLLLLILPSTILFAGNDGGPSILVRADEARGADMEDSVDGEDDEATVETDEGLPQGEPASTETAATETEKEEEEEEDKPLRASPNADTHLLYTKPFNMEFPAGAMVRLLVGFTNKGDKDFVVDSMDASFRYPQDYSFYIQNFTTVRYDRVVEPKRQATFEYAFTPSETFNARPFGLTINLNYKDTDGGIFQDAVFNDTINISEPDEGLDGETFFLYVFLAAVAVLLLVAAQQSLAAFGKKRLMKPKAPVEMGTQSRTDIDYSWLPEGTLDSNKSPKRSPRTSPRQRRNKRNAGSVDE